MPIGTYVLALAWFGFAAIWPPTVAYCQMAFTLLCQEGLDFVAESPIIACLILK